MNSIDIFAIAAGGSFIFLIFIRSLAYLVSLTRTVAVLVSKHLTYPYLLGRHRLFGPWTRFDILLHALYVTVNILCLTLPKISASGVGHRAGILSLVNLTFLFVGIHLSFIADILGVPLRKYRAFHRAVGWMVTVLSVVHIVAVVMINQAPFELHVTSNLFGLVVSSHIASMQPARVSNWLGRVPCLSGRYRCSFFLISAWLHMKCFSACIK